MSVKDLLTAAKRSDLKLVTQLLSKKVDVNGKNERGRTALMEATSWNTDLNVTQLLLSKGAYVNVRDNTLCTALLSAIWNNENNLQMIKYLVEEARAEIDVENEDGKTPIMLAAMTNQFNILQFLLSKTGSRFVNTQDKIGNTAIMYAVLYRIELKQENLEVIKLLLKHGANVLTENKNNERPIFVALHSEDVKLKKMLLDITDPNVVDENGNTLLMLTVKADDIDTTKELVKKIDVNIVNKRGERALDLADPNSFDILKVLVKNGGKTGDVKSADPSVKQRKDAFDKYLKEVVMKDFRWEEICRKVNNSDPNELRKLILENVDPESFRYLSNVFQFKGEIKDFNTFINHTSKSKLCRGLTKYYILSQCVNDIEDPVTLEEFNPEDPEAFKPSIVVGKHCFYLDSILQLTANGSNTAAKHPLTRENFSPGFLNRLRKN